MKEKFIKSTILLLIGGFLTKILALIIKIYLTRQLSTETLGLYMLILPTFILVINLSQFSFPLALSKLISEENRNNKTLLFSIIPIIIIINLLVIIILTSFAPIISNNLLKRKETYLGIISIALVLPFTTVSSICRSYFFGKERMFPHILSNIVENITRLTILFLFGKYFLYLDNRYTLSFLILINIISESISTIILIIFLPKNIKIKKEDLHPNKKYIKDSLEICIPNTTTTLISSIGYFLEPIILTYCLIKTNYPSTYITNEYGILTGYIIPLILLPSFFTSAIATAILPSISKEHSRNNNKKVKKILYLSLTLSGLIGLLITSFIIIKAKFLLNFLYHTNKGIKYLKVLTPFFLLQYLQAPLLSYLNATNKSQMILTSSIIGTTIRIVFIFIFSKLKIGIYSLILSTALNIIITTIYLIIKVKKHLQNN